MHDIELEFNVNVVMDVNVPLADWRLHNPIQFKLLNTVRLLKMAFDELISVNVP